jgi:hypothetical protein
MQTTLIKGIAHFLILNVTCATHDEKLMNYSGYNYYNYMNIKNKFIS